MFGGACVVGRGVLGGVRGWWGACVVGGGHAWLPGGVHGCWGCVVGRGHAWLLGGMRGCREGACMVVGRGGACIGYDEIRSMSGAVRILLECILVSSVFKKY